MNPLPWWCSSTLILTFALLLATLQGNTTFTFVNRCDYTVWPVFIRIHTVDGPKLHPIGFELRRGSSRSFQVPTGSLGKFWGRTDCKFDGSGFGSCLTGDCGSGQVECNENDEPSPPATHGQFSVDVFNGLDFYDISLVDGFNVPMHLEAVGGSGSCGSPGCIVDLNRLCPPELVFGDGKGCKTPCQAFGTSEYCCIGPYADPDMCKGNVYTEMFKAACPTSYSYAYDNKMTSFSCKGANYVVTFCQSSSFSSS